jgi:poly(A) polymerase
MSVIQEELERAAELTDQIIVGKRPWKDLFGKHTFFTRDFKYYIAVTSASKTKEAHNIWSGFVESKIRVLVQGLERHPSISLARPFTKGYERVHCCKNDAEIEQVQNGSVAFVEKEAEEADPKIKTEDQVPQANPESNGTASNQDGDAAAKTEEAQSDGSSKVYTISHYIGLVLKPGK